MNLTIKFPEPQLTQLCISFSGNVITGTAFCHSAQKNPEDLDAASFAKNIQYAFHQYFLESNYTFSLLCQLDQGTPFQQKVWQALTRIPSGQVETYGSLAKKLNTSARAIGNACRKNPFPVIVPCHRVISASDIGGFAGDTLSNQKGEMDFLQIKRWLLDHEQANY